MAQTEASDAAVRTPSAFLSALAFPKHPLVTREQWDRVAKAKLALELRNQAKIARGNAEIALGSVRKCIEKREAELDESARNWFAERASLQTRRYEGFIQQARGDEETADRLERELKREAAAQFINLHAAE